MSEKKPEPERISAIPPFGLRMLPALRKQIEEAAEANKRSLNAEIVARLELSLKDDMWNVGADPGVRDDVTKATNLLLKLIKDGREGHGQLVIKYETNPEGKAE